MTRWGEREQGMSGITTVYSKFAGTSGKDVSHQWQGCLTPLLTRTTKDFYLLVRQRNENIRTKFFSSPTSRNVFFKSIWTAAIVHVALYCMPFLHQQQHIALHRSSQVREPVNPASDEPEPVHPAAVENVHPAAVEPANRTSPQQPIPWARTPHTSREPLQHIATDNKVNYNINRWKNNKRTKLQYIRALIVRTIMQLFRNDIKPL